MPQTIAEFLKLPESSSYTGHCLRRTSTTLLADSGVKSSNDMADSDPTALLKVISIRALQIK